MRVWPIAMALSIVSQAVCSQPADADISPMKSCFQLEHVVQIECLEHLSREICPIETIKFRGAGDAKLDRE
jgi:hypothetical protein